MLGVIDIGMLHYRPVRDQATGALALTLVRKVTHPKSLNGLQNLKWSLLAKIHKYRASYDCMVPFLEVRATDMLCDLEMYTSL